MVKIGRNFERKRFYDLVRKWYLCLKDEQVEDKDGSSAASYSPDNDLNKMMPKSAKTLRTFLATTVLLLENFNKTPEEIASMGCLEPYGALQWELCDRVFSTWMKDNPQV